MTEVLGSGVAFPPKVKEEVHASTGVKNALRAFSVVS